MTQALPARRAVSSAGAGPLEESLEDVGRNERGHVPAPFRYFLHQARGEEAVFRVSRHEQRVDPREAAIHLRHLELVVEVADGPETFDDHRNAVGAAVVDHEALEAGDADVLVLRGDLAEQLAALVHAEEAGLRLVHEHRDGQLVVELSGPPDDVEMAVGHRVERPRTDRASYALGAHCARPYQSMPSP